MCVCVCVCVFLSLCVCVCGQSQSRPYIASATPAASHISPQYPSSSQQKAYPSLSPQAAKQSSTHTHTHTPLISPSFRLVLPSDLYDSFLSVANRGLAENKETCAILGGNMDSKGGRHSQTHSQTHTHTQREKHTHTYTYTHTCTNAQAPR